MTQPSQDAVDLELPEALPESPMDLFVSWLNHAKATCPTENPAAMALATVNDSGQPSLRFVLCRGLDVQAGFLVFYTNRNSRKGREITSCPKAAATFYWDWLELQVRVEGPVAFSPEEESDSYFAQRAEGSKVAAWTSQQSEELASRAQLINELAATESRFAGYGNIPRPDHWGGYRLYFRSVELWVGRTHRVHDRALWQRSLAAPGSVPGAWSASRLYP